MSITRTSTRAALAFAVSISAISLASPAVAQSQVGASQSGTLEPLTTPELGDETWQVEPLSIVAPPNSHPGYTKEKHIAPNGDVTIIITRDNRHSNPHPNPHGRHPNVGHPVYPRHPVVHGPVFEPDQWIAECERRTSGRNEKEKGGIIGSLLGAIGGGIAGNVIAGTGERLAGTLIGAGTGGLAGLLLGSLIGGGKKGDRYDCEAALDGYISQYGKPGSVRSIPHPYHPPAGYGHAPTGYGYAYTGQYSYHAGCGCHQPQIALVPIRTEVRQRVIVRETIKEKIIPGKPHPIKPHPVKPHPVKPSPKHHRH